MRIKLIKAFRKKTLYTFLKNEVKFFILTVSHQEENP